MIPGPSESWRRDAFYTVANQVNRLKLLPNCLSVHLHLHQRQWQTNQNLRLIHFEVRPHLVHYSTSPSAFFSCHSRHPAHLLKPQTAVSWSVNSCGSDNGRLQVVKRSFRISRFHRMLWVLYPYHCSVVLLRHTKTNLKVQRSTFKLLSIIWLVSLERRWHTDLEATNLLGNKRSIRAPLECFCNHQIWWDGVIGVVQLVIRFGN